MFEWLTVWTPISGALSLLANIGGAATLALYLYRKFAWERERQGLELDLQGLQLRVEGLTIQNDELERKRADHARYDPRTWQGPAPGTVLSGAGLEALKTDLDRSRQDIADAAAGLVDGYSEQVYWRGSEALDEALEYARIERALSVDLAPERKDALAELDATAAISGFKSGRYVSDEELEAADSQDKIDLRLVEGYVDHLMTAGFEQGTTGRNIVISELLLRRARRLAMLRLGDAHRSTIMARRLWAEQISPLGLNEEALSELEEILPLAKQVFGKYDIEVHHNLFAQYTALVMMGEAGSERARAVQEKMENLERRMHAEREKKEAPAEKAAADSADARFNALRWALAQWGMK